MQHFTYVLTQEPWIPCLDRSGRQQMLGLRDVLVYAHELKTLIGETPLHDAAMLLPLLAILHRLFGPKDERAWRALFDRQLFPEMEIDAYLTQWRDRFDLFHPTRPFYQAADDRVERKSLIHLIHSIGNTGALFTHADEQQGVSFSPAQSARALLVAQAFRTAGLSGLKNEGFTDGILTRGALFFADSDTLFEALMLNLVAYPESSYFRTLAHDAPAWEQTGEDDEHFTPYGYLDYLTWQSARILLFPQWEGKEIVVREMTIAPGLRQPEELRSPLKAYKPGKERPMRVDFSEHRALWRDYETLYAFDDDQRQPPVVVQWLHALVSQGRLALEQAYQLRTLGLLADQAKPVFYRDQAMPIPEQFLKDGMYFTSIQNALDNAENVAAALSRTLRTFATYLLQRGGERQPDKTDIGNLTGHWHVLPSYWVRIEPHFWGFIEALQVDRQIATETWQEILKLEARSLLEETISSVGPASGNERGAVRAAHDLNIALVAIFDNGSKQTRNKKGKQP